MNQNRLKAPVASLALPFLLATNIAGAEPYVSFQYKPGEVMIGGVPEKAIDCGLLYRPPSKPDKTFVTCAFATAVDPNSQPICTDTDPGMMPKDEAGAIAATTTATVKALDHMALVHKTCRNLAGKIDRQVRVKNGADAPTAQAQTDKKYGQDWAQDDYCPLLTIHNQCRAAMGLE